MTAGQPIETRTVPRTRGMRRSVDGKYVSPSAQEECRTPHAAAAARRHPAPGRHQGDVTGSQRRAAVSVSLPPLARTACSPANAARGKTRLRLRLQPQRGFAPSPPPALPAVRNTTVPDRTKSLTLRLGKASPLQNKRSECWIRLRGGLRGPVLKPPSEALSGRARALLRMGIAKDTQMSLPRFVTLTPHFQGDQIQRSIVSQPIKRTTSTSGLCEAVGHDRVARHICTAAHRKPRQTYGAGEHAGRVLHSMPCHWNGSWKTGFWRWRARRSAGEPYRAVANTAYAEKSSELPRVGNDRGRPNPRVR